MRTRRTGPSPIRAASRALRRSPVAAALALALLGASLARPAAAEGGAPELAPPSVAELLARSRAAIGGDSWASVAALQTEGKLQAAGLAGTFSATEDLRTGRYVTRYDLGVAKGAQGFDGEHPWELGDGGEVTVQTSREDLEAARNEAWRTARGLWFPERWPTEVEHVRAAEEEGRRFHVLRVLPRGGRPIELWLDAATALPARSLEQGGTRTTTTRFEDWREAAGGLLLPHRGVASTGHGPDTVIELARVTAIAAPEDAAFAPPVPRTDDFTIAGGKSSFVVPFELLNNHIYVLAGVDGGAPRRFLVDTGGVNLLVKAAADEMGIAAQGELSVGGVGDQREQAGLARLRTFTLGDATFEAPLFLIMPFTGLAEAEGVDFAGLVGFEVFKRFAITIDYLRGELTLTRPEAFAPPPGAAAIPFRFKGSHIEVDGTVDGVPGAFSIDTGSRSSLDLLGPFVEEHGLEARYAPRLETVTGWGVGGPSRSRVARAGRVTLGEVEVASPIVELSLQKRGAFTDRYVAGNVGTAILKRFTVSLDYARQRMYLVPNGSPAEPFDRSGVWLNDVGDAFRVEAVVPGGPAEQAGLAVGDRVVAVDGVAAGELRLPELRQRLKTSPPGTRVALRVARDGAGERQVELVLRELLDGA